MRRKPLVLIVEADPYLAGIYGRRLEMEKYQVRVAETLVDARKRIKRALPDALLVDPGTEGEQGFAFVRELRAEEETRSLPVILMTKLGDRASVAKGMEAGADAYLIKGHFVPMEAARKVRRLIEERKSDRIHFV